MPTDQFIEELTDGSPGAVGDLYALQRRVGGVWSDFLIRSENIAGSGIMQADVTLNEASYAFGATVLPQVPGFAYVIFDPPIVQVSGNAPTSGTGNAFIGEAGTGMWQAQFQDTETDTSYVMSIGGPLFNAGITDLGFFSNVFSGATVRIRFAYILAEI